MPPLQVSLMVFDECHHARKNHPYNGIMREYFEVAPESRPKVFGMTASPIWNTKDTAGSLYMLEKNLDSKVVGVRQHVGELAEHAPKPTEVGTIWLSVNTNSSNVISSKVVKEYPVPPELYDYPSPTLQECFNLFDIWTEFDIPWMKIQSRYFATLENLGPYCAELYLYNNMKHRVIQLLNESQDIDTRQLLEMNEIIGEYEPFFDDPTVPVTLAHCSPKVSELVSILLSHASSSANRFQGIIFVEQRQVASCLARILPRIAELKQCDIRCAELVGQNPDNVGGKGGGQRGVVKAFRDGEVNLSWW
jgi:endoribonuclease Dicer